MSELQIQRCEACGVGLFPPRLRCPECGGVPVGGEPAGPGRVEEETRVRHPAAPDGSAVRIGSVRLKAGPIVVARLDEPAVAGTEVRLELAGDGAIWARRRE